MKFLHRFIAIAIGFSLPGLALSHYWFQRATVNPVTVTARGTPTTGAPVLGAPSATQFFCRTAAGQHVNGPHTTLALANAACDLPAPVQTDLAQRVVVEVSTRLETVTTTTPVVQTTPRTNVYGGSTLRVSDAHAQIAAIAGAIVGSAGESEGGGIDNPDGWPESGDILRSEDYNTENAGDMYNADPSSLSPVVYDQAWVSNIGHDGSGAWKAWPVPAGSSGDHERNAGWSDGGWAPGEQLVFWSFKIRMTQAMHDNVFYSTAPTGATWMKFLDQTQVNNTTGNHRWVTSLAVNGRAGAVDTTSGMQFGLRAGGAGTALHDDGVNTNPDLTDYIFDEFVWICIVYDLPNTEAFIYWDVQSDANGVQLALHRDETTEYGTELYETTGDGWNGASPGIAGYWDFGSGFGVGGYSEDPDTQYIVMDDLVVSNYWVGPQW
jgi:hypothetical protein